MAATDDHEEHRCAAMAAERFDAMLDSLHRPRIMRELAERDRENHAPTYAPEIADPDEPTRFPELRRLRFMVEVCGITYEGAEKYILGFILNADPAFGGERHFAANDMTADTIVAAFRKRGAVEALATARLYNQAAKGTRWATFWNEVVRLVRTTRFAPLAPGIDLDA